MIFDYIQSMINYGVEQELINKDDMIYTRNNLLELLELDEWEEPHNNLKLSLEESLEGILTYALDHKLLLQDGIVARDLFDTKIMGLLTPKPSEVNQKFWRLYNENTKLATDYFYKLSGDNNYIRRERVAKDQKWFTSTPYGEMEITVNLSKPEKDPKAIALALTQKQSGYPKCLLCVENEGYAGRINHPARQNHRIIEIEIAKEKWGLQYSPYVYYNEHCIVLSQSHSNMQIDHSTFTKLLDFVSIFPHYFVGSNADLPIVGGSILTHEHYQGGRHTFAMAEAKDEQVYAVKDYEDIKVSKVKWPMSVIRLTGINREKIESLACKILDQWRGYSDQSVGVYASTDQERHNTITPIARRVKEEYQLDLVLRNNITTEEHPAGVFHPHGQYHNIKKENIGLIEVMGLAVLPARLKIEMQEVAKAIVAKDDLTLNPDLALHSQWVKDIVSKHDNISAKNVEAILNEEIGQVFSQVLECCGVFKRDENGNRAFDQFLSTI